MGSIHLHSLLQSGFLLIIEDLSLAFAEEKHLLFLLHLIVS